MFTGYEVTQHLTCSYLSRGWANEDKKKRREELKIMNSTSLNVRSNLSRNRMESVSVMNRF